MDNFYEGADTPEKYSETVDYNLKRKKKTYDLIVIDMADAIGFSNHFKELDKTRFHIDKYNNKLLKDIYDAIKNPSIIVIYIYIYYKYNSF